MRRAALLIGYLAALLALDHFASYPEQLGLGVATWALLLALAWRLPVFQRAMVLGVVCFATIGEVTGSLDLGRLPLPAAQPAAVRAAGARARVPDGDRDRRRARAARARDRDRGSGGRGDLGPARALRPAAPRRRRRGRGPAPARSSSGARATARSTRASSSSSRPSSSTARRSAPGAGRATLPGLGIPDGNPPSGVASGYVWFDVMALLVAPLHRRLRSEQRRGLARCSDLFATQLREHPPARRALQETELEQVGLVDVLDRLGLLAERDRERREPDRARRRT